MNICSLEIDSSQAIIIKLMNGVEKGVWETTRDSSDLFANSHPSTSFLSPDSLPDTPCSKLARCNSPFSSEQNIKSDSDSGP